MKNSKLVLQPFLIALALCVLARVSSAISAYAYISEIPNFVYIITDYIYVVFDALLLGVSVAEITYMCFNFKAKQTAGIFAALSLLYAFDSAVALVLDIANGAITSFDADLHIYPLLIATLYRILLYLAVWLIASRLSPRRSKRGKSTGFFHTVFGASLASISVFFIFDFASELIYAFDFLTDASFKISSSELSSMLGQFLLIIVSRALIPAIAAELYFVFGVRRKTSENSPSEKAGNI